MYTVYRKDLDDGLVWPIARFDNYDEAVARFAEEEGAAIRFDTGYTHFLALSGAYLEGADLRSAD